MKKLHFYLLFLLLSSLSFAQNSIIKGKVTDQNTNEAMIGVEIVSENQKGTSTDIDGNYSLQLTNGKHTLTFTYLGYETQKIEVDLIGGEEKLLDIVLKDGSIQMEETVITGSLFERRASEEVITIEVIKPDLIKQVNPIRFDEIARRIPGLNIVDGQANIRGGSGWSYGVGTRVQIVLDGQTFLSPDRQDVKWTFLPIETIGQVEVLKGASSVLYGSSAMNGTINIQSVKPQRKPQTVFTFFAGAITKGHQDSIEVDNIGNIPIKKFVDDQWWDNPLMTVGATFMRAHKPTDHFEYVVGLNIYNSFLHYEGGEEQSARINVITKWTSKKNMNLSWGLRGSLMYNKETEFFYWQNWYDGGFYRPGDLNTFNNIRFFIDPYLTYFGKRGIKHEFKNRIYINHPNFADKPYTIINSDYVVSKKWLKDWSLVAGANSQFYFVTESGLGGTSKANIVGIYAQADKKWDKVTVSAGSRWEAFRYNNTKGITLPQSRFGINYNPKQNAFVRFNIGQAFRFPSIAERFAKKDRGKVKVFPNPDVKPEFGFTSEIGYQQKITPNNGKMYNGSFDIAFYWQEYKDLVEFNVTTIPIPDSLLIDTIPDNPLDYIGFQSQNIERSRIAGLEATFKNNFKFRNEHSLYFMLSWNYSYPVQLADSVDSPSKDIFSYLGNLFKGIRRAENLVGSAVTNDLLKYRNRNVVTIDVEYKWKNLTIGTDVRYWSYVEAADAVFMFVVPDIADYRQARNYKGDWIFGTRAFYKWNNSTFGFIVKNLTNKLYTIRPAKPEAPRSFMFQYRYEF
jgi:outer membrane receptor protein involved in Fe transport